MEDALRPPESPHDGQIQQRWELLTISLRDRKSCLGARNFFEHGIAVRLRMRSRWQSAGYPFSKSRTMWMSCYVHASVDVFASTSASAFVPPRLVPPPLLVSRGVANINKTWLQTDDATFDELIARARKLKKACEAHVAGCPAFVKRFSSIAEIPEPKP